MNTKVMNNICIRTLIVLSFVVNLATAALAQSTDKYLIRMQKEDGTLWHLKETALELDSRGSRMMGDYTFQQGLEESPDSVTFNFTVRLQQKRPLSHIDSLVFRNADTRICTLHGFERFYVEKTNRYWNHRYSANISFSDFLNHLNAGADFNAILHADSSTMKITPSKDWLNMSAHSAMLIEVEMGQLLQGE